MFLETCGASLLSLSVPVNDWLDLTRRKTTACNWLGRFFFVSFTRILVEFCLLLVFRRRSNWRAHDLPPAFELGHPEAETVANNYQPESIDHRRRPGCLIYLTVLSPRRHRRRFTHLRLRIGIKAGWLRNELITCNEYTIDNILCSHAECWFQFHQGSTKLKDANEKLVFNFRSNSS